MDMKKVHEYLEESLICAAAHTDECDIVEVEGDWYTLSVTVNIDKETAQEISEEDA